MSRSLTLLFNRALLNASTLSYVLIFTFHSIIVSTVSFLSASSSQARSHSAIFHLIVLGELFNCSSFRTIAFIIISFQSVAPVALTVIFYTLLLNPRFVSLLSQSHCANTKLKIPILYSSLKAQLDH